MYYIFKKYTQFYKTINASLLATLLKKKYLLSLFYSHSLSVYIAYYIEYLKKSLNRPNTVKEPFPCPKF